MHNRSSCADVKDQVAAVAQLSLICGILQETVNKFDKKYLIVGIGINLIKSPNLNNYQTSNLYELINKKISKENVAMKLKKIFETRLNKLYK